MPVLLFPSPDVLRLALSSGMVPAATAAAGARVNPDEQGRLWLRPEVAPPREAIASLSRLGVRQVGDRLAFTGERVACWALALPLRAEPKPNVEGLALFVVPDGLAARFAADLGRRDRQPTGFRFLPSEEGQAGHCWLTRFAPPLSTVMAAAEAGSPIEVYLEQAPGLWTAFGFSHPLPGLIVREEGQTLLLRPPRDGRAVAGDVPRPSLPDFDVRPIGPVSNPTVETRSGWKPDLRVRFTLAKAETPPESLWVLAGPAVAEFEALLGTVDERLSRRFEAARLSSSAGPRILLRTTRERRKTFTLPWPSAGWYADPRIPGLFIPFGRSLRPALRPREIIRALELVEGRISWLEPEAGSVRCHSAPAEAFKPLTEFLEYRAPAPRALVSLSDFANPFPLVRFVATDHRPVPEGWTEPVDVAPLESGPSASPAGRDAWDWLRRSLGRLARRLRPKPREVTELTSSIGDAPTIAPVRAERVDQKLVSADVLLHGQDWPTRRRDLETRLLNDLYRLGPRERGQRWAELAGVYGAVGNASDAALCWLNAVWEAEEPPRTWLDQWFQAEARSARLPAAEPSLDRWLAEAHKPGVARLVAAYSAAFAAGSPSGPAEALGPILACLEQNFAELPVRAAWLARLALTQNCDGDVLALARWRDRLLLRLQENGPGIDLDEPTFLRFHGTTSADRFQTARDWLGRAREPIHGWLARLGPAGPLRSVGLEPEMECTAAYVDLMLAWGLACLGERARANAWVERSQAILGRATTLDTAVHAVLLAAFEHRIRVAQEGQPTKPGWPSALQAELESLSEFSRYKVERFQEHSGILDPAGHVRSFRGKDLRGFWGADLLGERLRAFFDRTDPAVVEEEARQLCELCETAPSSATVPRIAFTLFERARSWDGATVSALLGHASAAVEWFEAWMQAGPWNERERAELLPRYLSRLIERALRSAVAAGAAVDVRPFVEYLVRRASASEAVVRQALTRVATPAFRALRQLGLRAESEALLTRLDMGHGHGDPAQRVGLATGWFAVGDEERGNRILNQARDRLYLTGVADDKKRTALAIAYADALGAAPPRIALGRLEEIFQRLDRVASRGSTNTHYTLKPLQLIDTVVRAVVSEDFALGPAVRGWLDDDEFLIRRRIHGDLTAVLREKEG